MELILISAMTRDRVIGRDNGLPWNIPDEYAQFLGHVRGHPVIMGRSSYEIFGKDLTESPLVIVSRSLTSLPDAAVCPSIETAIERARTHGERVFSAGGASIYGQTLPLADAMYLSIVKGDYEGDTRFPEFDESSWVVEHKIDYPEFEFRHYRRTTSSQ
jgi:dihydrofolate reductase